ncbi:dephospho-CoA kinase [Lactobacillus bombicola]|uniref:Dephospho-CoA kinase n=1 Tax=Lactobacillus bombicola TaxID=1505723 RepID=A0A396SN95_9LACO|nr:dephospho-CoA kinase [Lactobacillus bombicola]RHW51042.1 dephospho-CoA kinase [Lactobacillus bombicola]RHW52697.1 dephospho-CoA kinase [Lactobacillus bombicola]RHW53140.1 dephospho-CoA kinase [Lactobacillus bombicola]
MTIVIGLTGGIASGKSTADAFFRKKKIPVIDSDKIAHEILNIDYAGYKGVVTEFGCNILNSDKSINRAKLGQIVFNDKQQLERLNAITHPLILKEIQAKITRYKKLGELIVVLDAPLLFEAKARNLCDCSILIALPESEQIKRLMVRDNLTEKDAIARINSQMSLAQKAKLADYVILNTSTIKVLETKLDKLISKIIKESEYGMS